jgi:hypothetical protein
LVVKLCVSGISVVNQISLGFNRRRLKKSKANKTLLARSSLLAHAQNVASFRLAGKKWVNCKKECHSNLQRSIPAQSVFTFCNSAGCAHVRSTTYQRLSFQEYNSSSTTKLCRLATTAYPTRKRRRSGRQLAMNVAS